MRDITTVKAEEWATLSPGEVFEQRAGKSADFRHFAASQAVATVDATGLATVIFLRSEANMVVQQLVFDAFDGTGARMRVQNNEINPHQVQCCHVMIHPESLAGFAAQALALLRTGNPDMVDNAMRGSGLI